MTELVLRAGYNDHVVLNELLTDPTALAPRHSRYIRRVVVDATAISREPAFANAASVAGTQLLVDPQTVFLTSQQHPSDNWCRLPYATSDALDPQEFLDPGVRTALVEAVVEFQLDHGATAIIPPYLHIADFAGHAPKAQRRLIKATAEHLADLELDFALFPLVSVDQRAVTLDSALWQTTMGRLLRTAHRYATGPIGLGLSMTTGLNERNLFASARIWRRAGLIGPFVAWHAGTTGLLAVAMGADGYEVGMCASERYDVRSQQRSRRDPPVPGPRYVGAYVDALGRSLGRSAVQKLADIQGVHQGDLGCLDPTCCRRGFATMLGHGRRQHAVRSRLRDLEEIDVIHTRRWKLRHLSDEAADSMASARRIRKAAANAGLKIAAHPEEFAAIHEVTHNLMSTARVTGLRGVVA